MKMLFFTACVLIALGEVAMTAAVPNSLSVEVDAARLKYRVLLHLENAATEYDSLDLVPVARGLAPQGARIHVKDDSGKLVGCTNPERGYSSAELYSGSPVPKSSFKKASESATVYSEWFDIADSIRGLDQCSRVAPEKWAKLMITFSIRTRGKTEGSVQGQSAWLDLTPADQRRLSGH
jgi:hypothetical protein